MLNRTKAERGPWTQITDPASTEISAELLFSFVWP